jgi:hypothetical protein
MLSGFDGGLRHARWRGVGCGLRLDRIGAVGREELGIAVHPLSSGVGAEAGRRQHIRQIKVSAILIPRQLDFSFIVLLFCGLWRPLPHVFSICPIFASSTQMSFTFVSRNMNGSRSAVTNLENLMGPC